MRPYYDEAGITIYHADCREVLPTVTAGFLLTDPPYGIDYKHGARAGGVLLGHDGQSIMGDREPFDPSPLVALGWPSVLWGGNHFADRLPPSKGWLVWDKREGRPSNDQSDCELAWTNLLSVARVFSAYWSGAVKHGEEQSQPRYHVNQKPLALMRWCLALSAADPVVDPYCGSGSTLVAAKSQGRKAIGIEIEERYCEIAVKRLAQEVLPLGGTTS